MSFTVTGFADGLAYRVEVTEPDQAGGDWMVSGPEPIRTLMSVMAGRLHRPTPTGEALPLRMSDPASIVAALCYHTEVREMTGDVPDVNGPDVLGAVY